MRRMKSWASRSGLGPGSPAGCPTATAPRGCHEAGTPSESHTTSGQNIVDEIHAAPAADGVESVLLPGEREWKNSAAANREGIPLPEDVRAKLREASEIAGIAFPGNLLC